MEEARKILNQLIELYNTDVSNDKKHELGSVLWTNYYKVCNENNITLSEGYNLYLMLENESYIIDQKPIRKTINNEELSYVVDKLNRVLNDDFLLDGINYDEAFMILDWTVENTRRNFESMGIFVDNNSLNGFCEIGQAISLMPLEKLGLRVTKNTASDSFNYPYNHCFGTVTFPIIENGIKKDVTFLLDTTYRQFFSTVRCNEGRYYTKEENTNLVTAPDPGYFMEDISFAKQLMSDGYVILNENTAKTYGEAFYLSSLKIGEKRFDENENYLDAILNTSTNYKVNDFELDGLNVDFPLSNKHIR